MSSEIKSCYIYSDDKSLSAIYLPDQAPITVGRSPETKITNTKCSRNQVRLFANYANGTVIIQQLGHHACGLNGYKTERGVKLIGKHSDRLEILYGQYPYCIEFNPPPVCPVEPQNGKKKRILTDSESKDSERSEKRPKKESSNESKPIVATENDPDKEMDFVDKLNTKEMLQELQRDNGEMGNGAEQPMDIDSSAKTNNDFWEELGTLMIYTAAGVQSRSKIAAYDMDNTLIKTQSGYAFPKDHNDWQILFPDVPGKLKKLHSEGYKIVIFTNQGGMFLGKVKPSDFKLKIERIVKKLGVPIQVFIATGKDMYRKPRTGMWEKLVNDKNDGVPVERSKSFFVGDAAGRPNNWAPGKKKDHSLADRLMSLNLELLFYTPEEHFLGHKAATYVLPEFNPKAVNKNTPICDPSDSRLSPTKQEVIIMVGSPGSGKTHFAQNYLKDYHYVNRDQLRSWQKCVSAMENALTEGKSVVIDNTNPDTAARKRFIDAAQTHGVPVRCFVMNTGKEHSRHNNKFRELTDSSHMTVSDVIINSYSKNYVAPRMDEGFTEIVRVNFVPRFHNDEHRRLYEMYLLEK
ncbi:uncharacterized protein F21D5.5 isoform X2 [Venturia canescens]|uniref:uncharacterized protein F21D5.5 isoform X2 n=1 Tax=Venturia canescens TaxID=32260 RepID=UPI001C9D63E0|nr:uncharacterized protein F21D5.5 isoform X2 [Venturia canescens]